MLMAALVSPLCCADPIPAGAANGGRSRIRGSWTDPSHFPASCNLSVQCNAVCVRGGEEDRPVCRRRGQRKRPRLLPPLACRPSAGDAWPTTRSPPPLPPGSPPPPWCWQGRGGVLVQCRLHLRSPGAARRWCWMPREQPHPSPCWSASAPRQRRGRPRMAAPGSHHHPPWRGHGHPPPRTGTGTRLLRAGNTGVVWHAVAAFVGPVRGLFILLWRTSGHRLLHCAHRWTRMTPRWPCNPWMLASCRPRNAKGLHRLPRLISVIGC